jgi:hypothetical protein
LTIQSDIGNEEKLDKNEKHFGRESEKKVRKSRKMFKIKREKEREKKKERKTLLKAFL